MKFGITKILLSVVLTTSYGVKATPPVDHVCDVKSIERDYAGFRVWSPKGGRFIVNKKDKKGVYQFYVGKRGGKGARCITCQTRPNGPPANRHKLQPRWHPSGEWIILAGERRKFNKPILSTESLIEGWIQTGLWVNMYMTNPDGSEWYRLSDFANHKADGFTGVAFTPDGKRAVWAQIVDGNVLQNVFGVWELILADFVVNAKGKPRFYNKRNITPRRARWVEVGNFAPDGRSLTISSDIGMKNAQGMDQFILDIETGQIRNLTSSRNLWDEHGLQSPDGKKIIYMSSYPFRYDRFWHNTIFLKTELMMVDKDGGGLRQLTHFNTPGYRESNKWWSPNSVAANGVWHPDGRSITALNLFFPDYEAWTIRFRGRCGNRRL